MNHIVHRNREIPLHPCSRSCPCELRFDLEYMQGIGKWKSAGAQHVGISCESDCPVFQCELPDGGLDIQDHRVYWHLANGAECRSLRELCAMSENQFELHEEGDAPDLRIGRRIGWVPLALA